MTDLDTAALERPFRDALGVGGRPAPRELPRREAPPPGELEPLDHYLRDIRDTRVLTGEEERALARRRRDAETALVETLHQLPATARALVADWEERRGSRRITGPLSSRHEGGRVDAGPEVDRNVAKLARDLARLDARSPRPGAAERRRLRTRITATVADIAPPPEWLLPRYRAGALTLPDPAVPRGEHHRLLARAAWAADALDAAHHALVQHNLRLVVSVAKTFRGMGVELADLVEEANVSLMRAVEKFDPDRGLRFSTYAVWWIRQACIRAVQNHSRTVRLPTHIHDRLRHYRKAMAAAGADAETGLGLEEVAERLGLETAEVDELARADRRPLGLDEPVPGTDRLRVGERLEASDVEDPIEGLHGEVQGHALARWMRTLPARGRFVLECRFGLRDGEPQTLQQVGDALGLSRERVRQIERDALAALRARARSEGADADAYV